MSGSIADTSDTTSDGTGADTDTDDLASGSRSTTPTPAENPINTEDWDLEKCPTQQEIEACIASLDKPNQEGQLPSVTIGDLHGNTLKALHFLIRYGIIKQKDGGRELKEIYADLKHIYNDQKEVKFFKFFKRHQRYKRFRKLLNELDYDAHCIPRFLGDVLADRGNDDKLTSILFETLHERNIDYRIIFSNHDFGFFASLLDGFKKSASQLMRLDSSFTKSMDKLQKDAPEQVKKLFKEVYLPKLKLIDYELTEEGLVLFSHAPLLNKDIILDTAKWLKIRVEKEELDQNQLINLIDQINEEFIGNCSRLTMII